MAGRRSQRRSFPETFPAKYGVSGGGACTNVTRGVRRTQLLLKSKAVGECGVSLINRSNFSAVRPFWLVREREGEREREKIKFLPFGKKFSPLNNTENLLFTSIFKNAHNARLNTDSAVELRFGRTTSRRTRFDAIYDTE